MKIVADQNMLMVDQFFGEFGTITYVPGRSLCAADIAGADILLVRSVTQVNKALLEGSSVSFVGSATIGTDHIDQDYLAQNGIAFAYAPGCNADAVVQYDLSVLSRLQANWLRSTVGIVGCGNVGGRLYRALTNLGVSCTVYDPFLSADSGFNLADFDTVLGSDVICVHTPLTTIGPHPTEHLFNAEVLARIDSGSLLINAGRGAVIDNAALLQLLESGSPLRVALDVWEEEPGISLPLMERVALATPHIAGYSVEGKARGTEMLAEAFKRLNHGDVNTLADQPKSVSRLAAETLSELLLASYDVADDDLRMREALNNSSDVALTFDLLRKQYPERHEFSCYAFSGSAGEGQPELKAQALKLGFR
ncbi:4-phosphoerythronate dehydrogenase [SAR92 clade bacterium H455]|uniref:Erythronate-4-phosphate dehydrogenase n=1 Tax=SAR92 clade bacterium H455 TaxID=2974818 RepID=A0ABY5TL08_9GAMM|nr:4-phosphoerythronate dehydrogenase [SAR92 clade bacterium H455]